MIFQFFENPMQLNRFLRILEDGMQKIQLKLQDHGGNMKRISLTAVIAGVTLIGITGSIEAAPRRADPDAKLHRYSTTIEKERPSSMMKRSV